MYGHGVGFHPFGRHSGKALKEIATTAALGMLDDAQIAELALQLRGDAGGRQVKDARLGLAHNAGGWSGDDPAVCVVHILESEQR